jgi:hypothetical protein
MKYADIVSADVPQSEPLDARQVANNAGGWRNFSRRQRIQK